MRLDDYDPDEAPDPREWLDIDEGERIGLIVDYHRRAGDVLQNARLHAAIHVVVENQLALGDPPIVRETLQRLQAEGLDRHNAIHAIGSAVADFLFDATQTPAPDRGEVMRRYEERLARLTADGFLEGSE